MPQKQDAGTARVGTRQSTQRSRAPRPREPPKTTTRTRDTPNREHGESFVSDSDNAEDSDRSPRRKRVKRSKEPDKRQKVKWLIWRLRGRCREALARTDSKFEEGAILRVWLGGNWMYKFDPEDDDDEAIERKWSMKDNLLENLRRTIYHDCIVASKSEKFESLLRSGNIHEEDVRDAVNISCDDQYTKPSVVGGKMKRQWCEKLCKIFRELAVEQTTICREKCFKPPMLQFKPGGKQGAVAVVDRSFKKLSDEMGYNSEWAWLRTCVFEGGRPVPCQSSTQPIATTPSSDVVNIVEAVTGCIKANAAGNMADVDLLWREMLNGILAMREEDLVTETERAQAHRNAKTRFENKDRKAMNEKGCSDNNDESWRPMPQQERDWMSDYWQANAGEDTINVDAAKDIAEKQKNAKEQWDRENLMLVVGRLYKTAKDSIADSHLLRFGDEDDVEMRTDDGGIDEIEEDVEGLKIVQCIES